MEIALYVAGGGLILAGLLKRFKRKKPAYLYFAQTSEWHHHKQRNKKKRDEYVKPPYLGI